MYTSALDRPAELSPAQNRAVSHSRFRAGAWALAASAVVLFVLFFHLQQRLPSGMATSKRTWDVWFDADIFRVVNCETDRLSHRHTRTNVHPLFSLASYPPVYVLRDIVRVPWKAAIEMFHAAIATAWVLGLFLMFRSFGCRRWDAALVTAAASTSAAALFWLTIPETFVLSSITLFPPLILASDRYRRSGWMADVLAHTAALSATITNEMAALASSFFRRGARRAVLAAALGAIVLLALSAIQKLIFPSALFPLATAESTDTPFLFPVESGGPAAILRAIFFHSMVAPRLGFLPNWHLPTFPLMSFQSSPLASGGPWAVAATVCWAGLLFFAVRALGRLSIQRELRYTILATMAGQVALHLIYGRETFLYSMHFIPLLMAAVALALLGADHRWVRVLLLALIVTNGVNNMGRWERVLSYVGRFDRLDAAPPPTPSVWFRNLQLYGLSADLRQRGSQDGLTLENPPPKTPR